MPPLFEPPSSGMDQHLAGRITTLEQLAAQVQQLNGASVADRAALHEQVDALLASLASEVAARAQADGALQAAVATLTAKVNALQVQQIRTAIATLPLLAVGNTDLAVTWQSPFPSATYSVLPTVEAGATILGKLTAAPKSGTRTTTGCTITVTNTGLLQLAAGQGYVHVLAYSTS